MRFLSGILVVLSLAACHQTPAPTTEKSDSTSAPVAADTTVPEALNTDTTDAVIAQIRRDYQRIQSDPNLTRQDIPYEVADDVDLPPMGGTLTLFFRNGQVVKVLDDGGEDHGLWKEEYYYRPGGELFFIYANNAYGGAENPTEFKYQLRLYLHEGRIYKMLSTLSSIDRNDTAPYLKKARAFYKARTAGDVLAAYQ